MLESYGVLYGGEAMHWLGNARLDRFVLRAVKQIPSAGCTPVTAMTQHMLFVSGTVSHPQTYPTEEDVYLSLMRLMRDGLIERYCDFRTGGIRYRACIYRYR